MKKKMKLHLSIATALPLIVLPLFTTMACSTKIQPGEFFEFDDSIFKTEDGEAGSGSFNNPIVGTSSSKLMPDRYFGLQSNAEANGENEPLEIQSRKETGEAKTVGIDPEFLWNWRPVKTSEGLNLNDPKLNMDYLGWEHQDKYWKNPTQDRYWGLVDGEFNRATVELRDRTFGEKLKPTQSALARFQFMPNLSWKNANNNLGMVPGMKSTTEGLYRAPQYADVVSIWNPGPIYSVKAPSGSQIDFAHRHGVPIMGAILLYARASGVSEHDFTVMLNPGPKNDYPVAKGIAEMANYIGFDGWFIDWETHQNATKKDETIEFLRALIGYCKNDEYRKPDGTIVKMTDDPGIVAARREFNYVPREQMISNYGGGNEVHELGDLQWLVQMHGGERQGGDWKVDPVSPNSIINYAIKGTSPGLGGNGNFRNKMDFFSANGASNWPEDAQTGSYGIFNAYQKASAEAFGGWDGEPTTATENMFSQWLWSITNTDLQVDQEMFDSFAGDPRAIDFAYDFANRKNEGSKWSLSNNFQERTSIIGRNNWTTTFDVGSGLNFNMWGSDDLKRSITNTNDAGWLSSNMQSHMPTYKFIIDEYNENNVKTNDLTLNASNKVTRQINPTLNNLGNAWFGGTTLKYDGKLQNVGDYFVNKLYASNVQLKTNDKFKLVIKNNLTDAEIESKKSILPELALWTNDNKVAIEKYKSDGTESKTFGKPVVIDPADPTKNVTSAKLGYMINGEYKLHKSLVYEKEQSWNIDRDYASLPISKITKKNGNKWLEIEYDLSSLNGKTMLNFGLKGIQNEASTDFSKLEIGQMSYIPASDAVQNTAEKLGIKSVNTDYRWDFATKLTTNVRISWETTLNDTISDLRGKIRNYFVFYVNEAGQSNGIGYIGANPVAHLTLLDKTKQTQNIRIVGIDNDYKTVISQNATIQLAEGK